MKKLLQVIILSYVIIVLFVCHDFSNADKKVSVVQNRQRRFLSFINNTHFFLRLNFKANMVPWNQIFAQALGFRMNWDDPPDTFHTYHHLTRRSVYDRLELLLDKSGLSGFHCIRRTICEMNSMPFPDALYYKVLKIIFRKQSTSTERWHNVTGEECSISYLTCSFSFLDISLYTDV